MVVALPLRSTGAVAVVSRKENRPVELALLVAVASPEAPDALTPPPALPLPVALLLTALCPKIVPLPVAIAVAVPLPPPPPLNPLNPPVMLPPCPPVEMALALTVLLAVRLALAVPLPPVPPLMFCTSPPFPPRALTLPASE